jgi:hypothetical protein
VKPVDYSAIASAALHAVPEAVEDESTLPYARVARCPDIGCSSIDTDDFDMPGDPDAHKHCWTCGRVWRLP